VIYERAWRYLDLFPGYPAESPDPIPEHELGPGPVQALPLRTLSDFSVCKRHLQRKEEGRASSGHHRRADDRHRRADDRLTEKRAPEAL